MGTARRETPLNETGLTLARRGIHATLLAVRLFVVLALMGCSAGSIEDPAPGARPTRRADVRARAPADADSPLGRKERAVRALLERHGKQAEFHVIRHPPFIVAGDGGARDVERRVNGTIAWAVRQLKQSFGFRDPDKILEVWLFSTHDSYAQNTRLLFGHSPDTPYGYYSPSRGALIMNIATGGGTLVHELVHPYIEANFPDCPAWFNEGLGSLYEASTERDGRIVGLVNWRLPGLQTAIRRSELPSFQSLLATSEDEFYGDDSGTNYAQARYLLYYLQEQDLLRDYYTRFHTDLEHDPSGYLTLRDILGERNMTAFQRKWERWVLELRWDPG